MSSFIVDAAASVAVNVQFSDSAISVDLSDGRVVSAPLAWYPRLEHGNSQERANWRLLGGGRGIHWPELDEDVSVENLLFGKPSGESQSSLKELLESRRAIKP